MAGSCREGRIVLATAALPLGASGGRVGADSDRGIEPVPAVARGQDGTAADLHGSLAGTGNVGPPLMRGHAFISYAREDAGEVDILQGMLEAAGVPVWRDTDSSLPKENWPDEIREAITHDALVFIACFSRHSAAHQTSHQYAELRLAIRELELRPPKVPWLIPVRFDDCEPPDFEWGIDERLGSLQRADLFGEHADRNRTRVVSMARQILGADSAAEPPAVPLIAAREAAVDHPAAPGIHVDPPGTGPRPTRRKLLVAASVIVGGAGASAFALFSGPGASPGETSSGRADRSGSAATRSPDASVAAVGQAAALIGHPLTGNGGTVYSVAFSPIGHTLASGSSDWYTRLWNVTDPAHTALLGRPFGYEDIVFSVAFSPSGHILASGCADSTVRLWNVTNPARPATLGPPVYGAGDKIFSVAFSPDGHTLAVGSLDETIWLWDVTDPAHPATLGQPLAGHANAVLSVAFSPDGHTLASGSADDTVRLWNVTNPANATPLGQPLTGYTSYVESVAFSPDGHTLASGCADNTIQLWNVTNLVTPAPLGQPLTKHTSHVESVAFSPDGRILASGSDDETVRLWNVADPANAAPLGPPLIGHTGAVYSVAFSPDGHTLASGSSDQTIRLWRIS